jgi:hypothetical protein
MRHPLRTALLALLIGACSPAAPPATLPSPAPAAGANGAAAAAAALITAETVRAHVHFLASDEMRGRDTPSPELERAAEYLAERLREYGLAPAGEDGTWFQRFPLQQSAIDQGAVRIEARHHGTTTSARFAEDIFVLPARVDSVVGTPVFMGQARPGIAVEEDVRGRIVVFFVPDTLGAAWQAAVSTALQASLRAGAGGAVLVLDPAFTAASIGNLAQELAGSVGPLPVVGVRYDVARAIFQHGGLDLGAVRGRTAGPGMPLQGVTMLLRAPISEDAATAPNVVAVLEGSDPTLRGEYVVYSAHFDHVGVGQPDATGDSIYNGADDNASGTTAVLETARAFAALPMRPARSILFVLVSGEEKGLLGSMFYVQNATVPVEQMVANINADMIGRNAPDTVVAIGQDYSTLGATVQRVAARHRDLGLTVAPDLWPEEQLFFRSDHFAFAAMEVPAIFFTTGLHEDYHRPSDRPEAIDNDKLARVARLLFHLGHELATAAERPQWSPEGLAEVRRATGRAP